MSSHHAFLPIRGKQGCSLPSCIQSLPVIRPNSWWFFFFFFFQRSLSIAVAFPDFSLRENSQTITPQSAAQLIRAQHHPGWGYQRLWSQAPSADPSLSTPAPWRSGAFLTFLFGGTSGCWHRIFGKGETPLLVERTASLRLWMEGLWAR